MSKLLTNVISVRGEDYEVSEIDGATMKALRKILTTETADKSEVEPYIVSRCLVSPKAKREELLDWPSFVLTKIANEAYRLSGLSGEDEAKNA